MLSRFVSSSILVAALAAAAHAQPAPAPTSPTPATPTATASTASDVPPPAPTEPAATTEPATPATPAVAQTLDAAAIEHLVDERVDDRIAHLPVTSGWSWKDGFFIQSADGASRLHAGGFVQFDGRFFTGAASGQPATPDQFAFRSVRPLFEGTVASHYDYRFMPDFAGGKVVIQDAYADIRYGDAVKLRAGKFKAPFGLERLQPEYATTFTERGLPTLLAPNRDLGVQVFGELAGGVFAYQVGLFNGVADGGSSDGDVSDGKEAAARVFVQPFVRGDSIAKNLGFGGAATIGDKNGTLASPDLPTYKTQAQTTWFQYKPDPNPLMPTLATTPVADGRQWRATAQADWYAGPIGVLAEYVRSVQRAALGDTASHVTADAWQVLGQWVLTGDDATYKSVTPVHPFEPSKGYWGAFDVAARVGQLTLDDNVFADGLADPKKSARGATSFGVGVDWFPNKALRLVLDLERTKFDGGAKAADGSVADRPTETSIVARVQTVF
jgi:phosphate-selective porin OprO/OprP